MHLRTFFLLLVLPLAACGGAIEAGPAGPSGPPGPPGDDAETPDDGEHGEDGEDGADGEDGQDGADGSAILSGTIDPGSFLSLTHGLGTGNLVYQGQFIKNDLIYDHSLYPLLFGPEYGPATELATGTDLDSDVDAAVLENGTIALLFNDEGRIYVMVVDAAGAEVVAPIDLGGFDQSRDLAALVGGGFVAAWNDNSDAFFVVQFDDLAEQVGDMGHSVHSDVERVEVEGLAGGGFVIAYSTGESGGTGTSVEVRSGADVVEAGPVLLTPEETFSLVSLPGGGFGVLARDSFPDGDGSGDAVSYFTLDADAVLLGELTLAEDYSLEMDTAAAPNGSVLLAFEYGGPDAMAYAVVDEAGTLISPPTLLSAHEPDAVAAGVFADGDFALFVGEDDTNVMELFVIGSTDGALRAPANVVGVVSPDDGRRAVLTFGDAKVTLLESAYPGNRIAMTEVSKGYLELRRVSDEEVQLHNFTPEALDATVAAHRTP